MAPLMFLVLALFLRPCRNRVPIKFSVVPLGSILVVGMLPLFFLYTTMNLFCFEHTSLVGSNQQGQNHG
jgi:hypothetical protein